MADDKAPAGCELAVIDMRLENGVFVADFSAMAKAAYDYVKQFDGIKIETDDDFKVAKAMRAELNKRAKEINAARLALGREYDVVKDEFYEQCKTLVEVFETAAGVIDTTIKARENEMARARRELLAEEYAGLAPDMVKLIPLDSYIKRQPKLLQRSWTPTKACVTLGEMVTAAVADREVLRSSSLDFEADADRVYCATLDLNAALAENKRLCDERAKREAHIEAARKLDEELSSKAAAASSLAQVEAPCSPEPVTEAAPSEQPAADGPLCEWSFGFTGTRDQAMRIAAFARSVGVESDGIRKVKEVG